MSRIGRSSGSVRHRKGAGDSAAILAAAGRWLASRLSIATFVLSAIAVFRPGWAVTPPLSPAHLPTMTMRVVRSNDPSCNKRCSDWIALDGPIGLGSAPKFARLVRSLHDRRLPVLVNSNGGSTADAMAMGRLIRAKHLDVAVSKTELTSCPADRVACETPAPRGVVTAAPVAYHAICASSCSFILAGGQRRFVALNAIVGVHQFRSFRKLSRVMRTFRILSRTVDGVKTEVSRTLVAVRPISTKEIQVKAPPGAYKEAQAYFAGMGITPRLMALAEATTPDSIHWLSLAELVATKMDTEGKDGKYLIANATPEVPATPSPQVVAQAVVPMPAPVTSGSSVPDTPANQDFGGALKANPSPQGWSRAMLVSEGVDDPLSLDLVGHVVWSVDATKASRPALMARVELPAGAGNATVRIVDLGSLPVNPEYRIEITLDPGPNSPFRSVSSLGPPAVAMVPQQPPVELQATIESLRSGTYAIDLTTTGGAADTIRDAMKTGRTLEFPLTVEPIGHHLRLVLERGEEGATAFEFWRSLVDEGRVAG